MSEKLLNEHQSKLAVLENSIALQNKEIKEQLSELFEKMDELYEKIEGTVLDHSVQLTKIQVSVQSHDDSIDDVYEKIEKSQSTFNKFLATAVVSLITAIGSVLVRFFQTP